MGQWINFFSQHGISKFSIWTLRKMIDEWWMSHFYPFLCAPPGYHKRWFIQSQTRPMKCPIPAFPSGRGASLRTTNMDHGLFCYYHCHCGWLRISHLGHLFLHPSLPNSPFYEHPTYVSWMLLEQWVCMQEPVRVGKAIVEDWDIFRCLRTLLSQYEQRLLLALARMCIWINQFSSGTTCT